VRVGQQDCRLLLEAGKNVQKLFESSAVDGFRENALFNALLRSDVLTGKTAFFEGLKQLLC
jgi:hypothetical protein